MDIKTLTHVLVPTDLTPASMAAIATAVSIVGDAQIHVLCVLPDLHPVDPAISRDLTPAKRRERAAETVRRKMAEAGHEAVGVEVAIGEPAWAIVDAAKSTGTGLIVMASHQYSGLQHVLLGSVAERVVRRAPCPVLVIPVKAP